MPLRPLADVAELDRINAEISLEVERIKALCDVYLRLPAHREYLAHLDPFSLEYNVGVQQWLGEITNRENYHPARDELAPYLDSDVSADHPLPSIYKFGDGALLGDMLQSFGAVLKTLNIRAGASVLEYGPGDGQICLNLARLGCRVTAVDVEPRYLALIRAQAAMLGTNVQTIHAEFGSAEPDVRYDRILFFEAFHHALGHQELMAKLRAQLAPDGFIVFAGEPILAPQSYFRPTLPYAWGPRLDGLSLRAMRAYGWCELGFAREYFIDLLMRSGFAVSFRPEPATDRGSAYIATAIGRTLDLGAQILVEATGLADCWHTGEGKIRWSAAPVAAVPIDRLSGWRHATIDLHNLLPVEKAVVVTLDASSTRCVLAPGEARSVRLPVASEGRAMTFACDMHRPCDLNATSADSRALGIAVSKLHYSA